jgi:hypothetical protein
VSDINSTTTRQPLHCNTHSVSLCLCVAAVLDTSSPEEKAKLGKHKNKKGKPSNWVFKDRQSEQWVQTFLPESAVENLERRGVEEEERTKKKKKTEKKEEYFIRKMNDENVLDWNLVQNFIIIIIFCIFFYRTETIIILYNSDDTSTKLDRLHYCKWHQCPSGYQAGS